MIALWAEVCIAAREQIALKTARMRLQVAGAKPLDKTAHAAIPSFRGVVCRQVPALRMSGTDAAGNALIHAPAPLAEFYVRQIDV